MNSASFDVFCLCLWKCLIVAKNLNTYAVRSSLHAITILLVWCFYHFNLVARITSSCRAMNSASFDVFRLCFWKCLIVAKIQTLMQFVRVCVQSRFFSFDVFYHFNLVARITSACRAMNTASFDVLCLRFWKCLIVAKKLNTYAVCSWLHTYPDSCRLMFCIILIWLRE